MNEQLLGVPTDSFDALMAGMGPQFIAEVSGPELGASAPTNTAEPLGRTALQVPFGAKDGERLGPILDRAKDGDEDEDQVTKCNIETRNNKESKSDPTVDD